MWRLTCSGTASTSILSLRSVGASSEFLLAAVRGFPAARVRFVAFVEGEPRQLLFRWARPWPASGSGYGGGATAVLAARNQVPCRSRRMTSEKALSDGRLDPRRQATRLSVWPMASDDNAATSARLALHLIQPPLNSKTKTTISNIRPRPPP